MTSSVVESLSLRPTLSKWRPNCNQQELLYEQISSGRTLLGNNNDNNNNSPQTPSANTPTNAAPNTYNDNHCMPPSLLLHRSDDGNDEEHQSLARRPSSSRPNSSLPTHQEARPPLNSNNPKNVQIIEELILTYPAKNSLPISRPCFLCFMQWVATSFCSIIIRR